MTEFLHLLLVAGLLVTSAAQSRPNIVFVLADDLGWNDVSFHGSRQIPTPNLDALAYDGILLGNYYVQPICTPTRGALMTARHPIHLGLQAGVINAAEPWGLGLEEKIMPQYMKEMGYATHIVGKWHLGFFAEEYTPTHRGFDSHFGYYQGCEDYWDHTYSDNQLKKETWGLDFWRNNTLDKTSFGQYSTEIFTTEAENIIKNHDTSQPLFMYFAHQAIHSGNPVTPVEAPWKYVEKLGHIKDKNRRTVGGAISALDESVANLTKALTEKGILNNTIIVFSTDNGGPPHGFDFNFANNYPLRGIKATLWEGGVRGAGFIWSPLLKQSGYTSQHMLQVFDWLPTLLHAAGYDMTKLPAGLDGIDQWEILSENGNPVRTEMLHNVHGKSAAVRVRDMKLSLSANNGYGSWDGWYPPEQVTTFQEDGPKEIAPAHMFKSDLSNILRTMGRPQRQVRPLVVHCGPKPANASTSCKSDKPCLFNITADPCEYNDLADRYPVIVKHLIDRINYYNATAVPTRNKPDDPSGHPGNHNGAWVPWIKLDKTSSDTNHDEVNNIPSYIQV